MSLTHPGDERLVIAAARELVNIMEYRGLSPDQMVQALIATSASTIGAVSSYNQKLIEQNLSMFCRCLRERARGCVKDRVHAASKRSNRKKSTINIDAVVELIGQIVKFKARNLKAAQYEVGILESVDNQPSYCGGPAALVRMKDKKVHRISLDEFEVTKR